MKKNLHLFYIGSYLHMVVADSIISERQLPLCDVLFITYRSVKLPPCYKDNLLYDESLIENRRKFFIHNYYKLMKICKGKNICGYFPFQNEFPVVKFFSEYVFFEEGMGVYDLSMNYAIFNKKKYAKWLIKYYLMKPFFSKNLLGLYNGRKNGSPFPFDCSLIGLTENSYKAVVMDNCIRKTVHVTGSPLNPSGIKNSFIIVMDYTRATDRMESADNYLQILADVLRGFNFESKKVYLKLHPDNYKDMDSAMELIRKYIGFVDFEVIDESLEDVALSNQNNTFIGTHSTILFYAPVYGKSNKSISFARINAERDKVYANWLKRWGGIEGALALFGQQMQCL